MIEIAESKTLERQINAALIGKRVNKVYTSTSPHKFCWYNGDPNNYDAMLQDKIIKGSFGHGMYVDIYFEEVTLAICDGTNMRYFDNPVDRPEKYQLLIEFDDQSSLVYTVAMYGGIFAFEGYFDNAYYQGSLKSISPLNAMFDENYFNKLISELKKDMSIKAFLATEQRIPGLGNGSLQDILLSCGLHPKRKIRTLKSRDIEELFYSVKAVLADMESKGGRDTERDMYGNCGKYKTMLSKNAKFCPLCGGGITKESYLGGSIYYCMTCQKLNDYIE